MIEFQRFGSQIPGAYHGCCAVDLIQGFDCKPEDPASSQLLHGDLGTAIVDYQSREAKYLGPTNLDVFKARLRIGTFNSNEMKNHAFLAVLTGSQLDNQYSDNARKWLAILKEHGFEFIRAWYNSVYSMYRPPVYLFGLFRTIGANGFDPNKPPEQWDALPAFTKTQEEFWSETSGDYKILTEAELREKNVPVWLGGKKGELPKIKPVPVVETESPLLQPLPDGIPLAVGDTDVFLDYPDEPDEDAFFEAEY